MYLTSIVVVKVFYILAYFLFLFAVIDVEPVTGQTMQQLSRLQINLRVSRVAPSEFLDKGWFQDMQVCRHRMNGIWVFIRPLATCVLLLNYTHTSLHYKGRYVHSSGLA